MKTIIQPSNFNTDDFRIANNTVSLKSKTEPDFYTIQINSGQAAHTGTTNNEPRRRLYIQKGAGFGYLHLDFTASRASSNYAFTFPSSTPKPNGLIEVQTWDGGSIWIDDNGNQVKFSGLTVGRRYIVDMVGFWQN